MGEPDADLLILGDREDEVAIEVVPKMRRKWLAKRGLVCPSWGGGDQVDRFIDCASSSLFVRGCRRMEGDFCFLNIPNLSESTLVPGKKNGPHDVVVWVGWRGR